MTTFLIAWNQATKELKDIEQMTDRAALVEQMYETFFKGDMNAVLDLIRAEVLEEAARVAGPSPDDAGSDDYKRGREHAAAAIRALKGTT